MSKFMMKGKLLNSRVLLALITNNICQQKNYYETSPKQKRKIELFSFEQISTKHQREC